YRVLLGRLGSMGACSGGAIRKGTVGAVRHSQGACRSKGLVAGEHPPARFAEAAGDLDAGDRGAAPAAVAVAHPLDDRSVVAGSAGGVGGLDQRPAEVVGAVLGERTAAVSLTGLVDARAETGVADQLARCREAVDVADLAGDRVGEDPGNPGRGAKQRHVRVV